MKEKKPTKQLFKLLQSFLLQRSQNKNLELTSPLFALTDILLGYWRLNRHRSFYLQYKIRENLRK